jgi:hypothetical protein
MSLWKRAAVLALAAGMAAPLAQAQMAAEPVAADIVPPVAGADADAPKSTATEVQPTKLNLDYKNASPEEVFDQIGRQAGVELLANDQGMWQTAEPVTISVKDAPFWPTFLEVCKQSKIGFQPYYDSSRPRTLSLTRLQDSRIAEHPYSHSGGFVVMAQSANRNYGISYSAQATSNFSLQLMVLCDPALQVSEMSAVTVLEALDENGLSLKMDKESSSGYSSQRGFVQSAALSLAYPDGAGRKLALLKGSLRSTVVVKMEEVTIHNPLTSAPTKKQLPDYDVTIGPLKKPSAKGGSYELKVSFGNKAQPTGGLRRSRDALPWNLVSTIELYDGDGRRLNYNGRGGGSSGYTVNFNSHGEEVGEPQKLVWRLPAETSTVPVTFELKDLVIP